jgi:hypothetical protein
MTDTETSAGHRMRSFLREFLPLLYYAYFKPSALQDRLNEAAPQGEGDTSFWQLSLCVRHTAGARRFLAQCTLWWLLELIPFWYLTWDTIPWLEKLLISGILLLAGWGLALLDLPVGLASPLLLSLTWGLEPRLWAVLQTSLLVSFDQRALWLLVIDLLLGVPLVGGGAAWAVASGRRRLVPWFTGAVTFAAVGMAVLIAGNLTAIVAGSVAVVMAGSVTSLVVAFVAREKATGVVAGAVAVIVAVGVLVGTVVGIADNAALVVGVVVVTLTLALVAAIATQGHSRYDVMGSVACVVTILSAIVVKIIVADGVMDLVAGGGGGFVTPVILNVIGGGLAVVIAGFVAGNVAGSVARSVADSWVGSIAGVMAGVVAGSVSGGTVGGMASLVMRSAAAGAELPLYLALGLALLLGTAFSPRRSLRSGLVLATVVVAFFAEPQGWREAGLALLVFLVGYFRLLLYPLALLSTAAAARWPRFRLLASGVPDEVVWLRLYGLDRLLVEIVEENHKQGRDAIVRKAESLHQRWAARPALVRLSARAMTRYRDANEIQAASKELAWLPDEPDESLRGMTEVQRRMEEVAQQVKAACSATSDYRRLQRLLQARVSVQDARSSFATFKDRNVTYFVPAVQRWDHLISSEIARLSREKESRVEIPNPYTVRPVQLDEETIFARRPDLVRAVEDALAAMHGKPTLALYGPRRMGKTTFLLHMPRLLPDEVLPVYVDLQEAVQVSGVGDLYYNWAAFAVKAARDHRRVTLPSQPTLDDFRNAPAIVWREWLDKVEEVLGKQKLFFTFDEFEWLVDIAEKHPPMEEAFSILRHISQHRPCVYLLFAGAHRLEELAPGGRWHDYFINVRGIEVSYLAEEHARRLITNPISDFPLNYAPGAVDEIIHLTRCQPMLVQLMGSLLVEWLNSPTRREQGNWLTATTNDVTYAAKGVLSAGHSAYFANLWEDAGEEGRQVLQTLAQAPDGFPQGALQRRSGLEVDHLQKVLSMLTRYQLVEQVGGRWRIQVELTRRAFARLA